MRQLPNPFTVLTEDEYQQVAADAAAITGVLQGKNHSSGARDCERTRKHEKVSVMSQTMNPFSALTDEEFQQVTKGVEGAVPALLELFQQEPAKSGEELMSHTSLAKLLNNVAAIIPTTLLQDNVDHEQMKSHLLTGIEAIKFLTGCLPIYDPHFQREYLLLAELLTLRAGCIAFEELRRQYKPMLLLQHLEGPVKRMCLLLGCLQATPQPTGDDELTWVTAACQPVSFYDEKITIVERAIFRTQRCMALQNPFSAVTEEVFQQLHDGKCDALTELLLSFADEDKGHKAGAGYTAAASSSLHQCALEASRRLWVRGELSPKASTNRLLDSLLTKVGLDQRTILALFSSWLSSDHLTQLPREHAVYLLLTRLTAQADIYEQLVSAVGGPPEPGKLHEDVLGLVEVLGMLQECPSEDGAGQQKCWRQDVLLGSSYYREREKLVADSIRSVFPSMQTKETATQKTEDNT